MQGIIRAMGYLGLLFILYFTLKGYNSVFVDARGTFQQVFFIWMHLFLYTVFGMLLGIEKLRGEFRKRGTWRWNWVRTCFLTLPALYLVSYFPLGFNYHWLAWLYRPLTFLTGSSIIYAEGMLVLFPIVLGYSVITSPYKTESMFF